jgi:hypothetical protein
MDDLFPRDINRYCDFEMNISTINFILRRSGEYQVLIIDQIPGANYATRHHCRLREIEPQLSPSVRLKSAAAATPFQCGY